MVEPPTNRIQRFEDLPVWKLSRQLTAGIYKITKVGDFNRDFALRDQIRKASISIVSNIAEGFERDGDREFLQLLSVAKGSCGEVRAQLSLALDQQYISNSEFKELATEASEISRQLSGLMRYLRQSQLSGRKYRPVYPEH